MIIFMGLAGSGKTTQGQLLAARLHCPWISTGNLLREFNMDAQLQKRMLKGEIISDEFTLKVLSNELDRIEADHDECILDGSPRTLKQAEWLVDRFKNHKLQITGIIHINISEETAKKRLLSRHRPDDYDEAIAERFREYEQNILPIINYFKKEGFKLYEIDGDRRPAAVAKEIEEALGLE
jgi:adenylate kinase